MPRTARRKSSRILRELEEAGVNLDDPGEIRVHNILKRRLPGTLEKTPKAVKDRMWKQITRELDKENLMSKTLANVPAKKAAIEIFKGRGQKPWNWHLLAPRNRKITARGSSRRTYAHAEKDAAKMKYCALSAVIVPSSKLKSIPKNTAVFVLYKSTGKQPHRWKLLSAFDRENIARGEGHRSRGHALRAARGVKYSAIEAPIVVKE